MSSSKIAFVLLLICVFAVVSVTSASTEIRQKRGLAEEADKVLKQTGGSLDANNVGQLADLVAKNGAEECLARVICELTHNPKAHGDAGNKFAQSLLKFRQSKHPKVKKYVDAMSYGAKAKSGAQCKSHFVSCEHSTQEIVQVGNKVLRT